MNCRRAAYAAIGMLFLSTSAQAVTFGHPGSPTPSFSMRSSVGLGYSYRQLDGENAAKAPLRDGVRRFLIVGKISMLPADWIELGGTLMGADAKRTLTGFQGQLGVGGGGYLAFHPLRQEEFGINLTLGAGANVIRNHGSAPNTDPTAAPDTRVNAKLKEREYFGYSLVSHNMKNWSVYGGFVWNLADIHQNRPPAGEPQLANVKGRSQFGMVVGVDYFITPLVYFSLEGQNFNQDAITGAIGLLIAPN